MNVCALGTRGMTWEANESKFGPTAGVQPGDGKRQCLRETWQACTCCSQGREAGGTAAAKWGKKVSDGAVQPRENSGTEEALAMRGERRAVVEERHWSRATVSQEGAQIMVTSCPQITSNEVGGKVQSARVCVWHRQNGWQGTQVAARGCTEHMRRQTPGACCVVTAAEQPWQTRQQGS